MDTTIEAVAPAPTDAQLQRILQLATRAPSAGNMQPWRFTWNRDILKIRLGAGEPSALNHEGRVSAMTLGGLLECLVLAATTEGFDAEITLDESSGPAATVRFVPRAGAADPLAQAIAGRITDRRDFLGGSLSDRVFAEIGGDHEQVPDCGLHLIASDRYPEELLRYIDATERFFWIYKPVQQQVMQVLRWTPEEAERTRDGVTWKALGIGESAARILRYTRTFTVQRILNRLGFLAAVDRLTRSALKSSAGIGLITTRAVSQPAFVACGRLHTRAWLRLHAAGYALQPFTAASLYAAEAEAGLLPAEWPDEQQWLFGAGGGILRRSFGLAADEVPVWLFRAGKSPGPVERELVTYRYQLERVLDGAP